MNALGNQRTARRIGPALVARKKGLQGIILSFRLYGHHLFDVQDDRSWNWLEGKKTWGERCQPCIRGYPMSVRYRGNWRLNHTWLKKGGGKRSRKKKRKLALARNERTIQGQFLEEES